MCLGAKVLLDRVGAKVLSVVKVLDGLYSVCFVFNLKACFKCME
jgi:hypothetical protein